jgi:hypothetical protein
MSGAGQVSTSFQHVVYSRDADGLATLYVNGTAVSSSTVSGALSNWDVSYPLALADEIGCERPWAGTFDYVAIYDRALSSEEVADRFGASEGEGASDYPDGDQHSLDQDNDGAISLAELLRAIQFFNASEYGCAGSFLETEDGYEPHAGTIGPCPPHALDYAPQDWKISLKELLRGIQIFNSGGYIYCPEAGSEDGYCTDVPDA